MAGAYLILADEVAPLAGSVDRNGGGGVEGKLDRVAPLAGSVDRNKVSEVDALAGLLSLPSRGAWIEIPGPLSMCPPASRSLPSRGAWIEISQTGCQNRAAHVAPLAGSVDRNVVLGNGLLALGGRSPHGERG